MNRCRGSAVLVSMLLLVILSALGMYVVTVPVGTGESASRHHRAAVARNMARAGANAAIARFPVVNSDGSPYVRRIPVGTDVTGRYSVTSRKAGTEIGPGPVSGFEEYDLVSVGSVADLPGGDVRVVARIRYGPDPAGHRASILKWEESGPR
ncbi:MAG: hypothetical protein ACXWWV_08430 [Candidatus Deferrimicrobiaceae bacterium]